MGQKLFFKNVIDRISIEKFHLCESVLTRRFEILVKKKFEDIGENFTSLKKKYLWTVWALFAPFLFLSNSISYAIVKLHGWPDIKSKDMGQSAVVLWVICGTVIVNLPDVISICIYFRMWNHFRTKIAQSSDFPDAISQNELDSYGGIWVGEANEPANDCLEHVQEHMPPENLNNQDNFSNSGQEAKAVMDALRCHMFMALLDIVLATRAIFACSVTRGVLVYLFQVVFIYWIPLLVIVNGFQQFRRHGKYHTQLGYVFSSNVALIKLWQFKQ